MEEYSLKRLKSEAVKGEYDYEVRVKIGMFSDPVTIWLDELTKKHAFIISRLIDTHEMSLKAAKAALLFHYVQLCGLCDWGRERGKDNPFKIHTPDDAWSQAKVVGFHIKNPGQFEKNWAVLELTPTWEDEHGAFIAFLGDIVYGLARDSNFAVEPCP